MQELCTTALLQKINNPKRQLSTFFAKLTPCPVLHLCFTELVIGINEHGNDSFEGFEGTTKTSASPCKDGDVVAQVGVYTFKSKGVIFVCYVADVVANVD